MHPLIPESYGGTGLSALDSALAAEALSAVDLNVPTTLLATGLGREPSLGFGTPEQQRHGLPQCVAQPAERLAAFAFTEVTGGANFDYPDPAVGVRTHARREGDEWVISRQKHDTTLGLIVNFARSPPFGSGGGTRKQLREPPRCRLD